ncbi:MAG: hemolysin family protein [Bacteroidales bacterium]|nr:hemolysin family protein [Bacteroidales bacterium]
MTQTIIYILIVIALSAFFSGMEIAFVSVDKLRLEVDKKPGVISSILSFFFRHPNEFISTMLVGNNIVLVVYGMLMAQVIETYWLAGVSMNQFALLLLETVVSTLIILVTGEFLPKTLFKINPNLMMRVFALPLFIFYIVLYPISRLSSGLSYIFLRLFGMPVNKEASDKAFGRVDLDYFVTSSIENAENEDELDTEVKIFHNAMDFSTVKIRDCIVPRTEIVAVDLTDSMNKLMSEFIESGISKVIVYDGNIDNVVGYVHSSEMFRNPTDWHQSIKKIPIVPETMSAHKLMTIFMQEKKSIAVVVDEFGGTAGIVSLEDLVEEIFGDIEDEHDNTSYICKQVGEHEYLLSGRMEIEKVNETLDLDLPESDDYITVGGLILDAYQSFPKLHDVVTVGRYEFKMIKITATKIEIVRLKVNDEAEKANF